MRIAIVGAGNVGRTLGKRFAESGHEVMFGVREPDAPKTREMLSGLSGKAAASSNHDAAA